jgi:hypothetical protein
MSTKLPTALDWLLNSLKRRATPTRARLPRAPHARAASAMGGVCSFAADGVDAFDAAPPSPPHKLPAIAEDPAVAEGHRGNGGRTWQILRERDAFACTRIERHQAFALAPVWCDPRADARGPGRATHRTASCHLLALFASTSRMCGPGSYCFCLPRHPTHFEPSVRELDERKRGVCACLERHQAFALAPVWCDARGPGRATYRISSCPLLLCWRQPLVSSQRPSCMAVRWLPMTRRDVCARPHTVAVVGGAVLVVDATGLSRVAISWASTRG